MQWVVTTGRTVDDAKERALDALGIDASELDFEVLAEPHSSLFGLRTGEAKVRARVRPTRPRPKIDRRNRKSRRDGGKRRRRGRDGARSDAADDTTADDRAADDLETDDPATDDAATDDAATDDVAGGADEGTDTPADADAVGARGDGDDDAPRPADHDQTPSPDDRPDSARASRPGETRGAPPMSDITLDEQEPTALDFVTGLVEAFGFGADVSAHREDEEAIEVRVDGDDLGLLVGPRGATLASIAELTRTAVAQQHSGRLEGRLRVDVGGYRARRKEALIRFAGQMADKVLDSGEPVALEPMSPPDRKIVHDAVNDIDGVHTISRGEDRRRHVVIQPDDE